jgi:hypothetical protein
LSTLEFIARNWMNPASSKPETSCIQVQHPRLHHQVPSYVSVIDHIIFSLNLLTLISTPPRLTCWHSSPLEPPQLQGAVARVLYRHAPAGLSSPHPNCTPASL